MKSIPYSVKWTGSNRPNVLRSTMGFYRLVNHHVHSTWTWLHPPGPPDLSMDDCMTFETYQTALSKYPTSRVGWTDHQAKGWPGDLSSTGSWIMDRISTSLCGSDLHYYTVCTPSFDHGSDIVRRRHWTGPIVGRPETVETRRADSGCSLGPPVMACRKDRTAVVSGETPPFVDTKSTVVLLWFS